MATIEYNEAESFPVSSIFDTLLREQPTNTVISFQLKETPRPGETIVTHGTYKKGDKGMYYLTHGIAMFFDENDEQLGAHDGSNPADENQAIYPDEIIQAVDFYKMSIRFINVPTFKKGQAPF